MNRASLHQQLIVGILMIGGILFGYWRSHPPWSRTDGPPHGTYTISVPAYWSQSYMERFDIFTMRSEDDGMSPAIITVGASKVDLSEYDPYEDKDKLLKAYKKLLKAEKVEWGENVVVDGVSCQRFNADLGPQRNYATGGSTQDVKAFVVLVREPEQLQLKYQAEVDDYPKYEDAAMESVKSLRF